MDAMYNRLRACCNEQGSQSLEAVGVSVATALVALAFILGVGSILVPGVGRTVQCAVATVLGEGGCAGRSANGGGPAVALPLAPMQERRHRPPLPTTNRGGTRRAIGSRASLTILAKCCPIERSGSASARVSPRFC